MYIYLYIKTALGARPGIGTEGHYKTPADLPVKIRKTVINIGRVRVPPRQ